MFLRRFPAIARNSSFPWSTRRKRATALKPRISGVKLRDGGKLYQIAPPSANSTNEAGKEPAVKIVETVQDRMPDSMLVPPVSVSLYEFDVA